VAAAAAAAARARDIDADGGGSAEDDQKARGRKGFACEEKKRGRWGEDASTGRKRWMEERTARTGRNMGNR
jgi:hypothetical protein